MRLLVGVLLALALVGCGGGKGGDGGPTVAAGAPGTPAGCAGGCAAASPTTKLSVDDVNHILSQAVQEAQARGMPATIAVVDRSGNVLAVYQMTGAPGFTIDGGFGVVGGLDGLSFGAAVSPFAAISKAITGAYLSSEGNAFSTRTASQIVQENFNPGEIGSPSGPLFGVQFSSLSCSDVVLSPATSATAGPKPTPLGLAADPGGLPLYKNGIVVGGIGVMADGIYGLDRNINDVDQNPDELIAVAGARGFDAPIGRRADHITADGRTFRYTDSEAIVSNPAAAPLVPTGGGFVAAGAYYAGGGVLAGVAFSTVQSGFRLDTTTPEFAGLGAYVLDNGAGTNRYPPTAGAALTATEVTRILAEAIKIANRARAQIRQPLGTPAQVTISVVDTTAAILGVIRTPDAPVFGTDVAIQKARTALLFSSSTAVTALNALGGTIPGYISSMQGLGAPINGVVAYSNRSVGNLARPFLPDGINSSGLSGPLSLPFSQWSPFNDGLQLDLVKAKVLANAGGGTISGPCNTVPAAANGIQIFPGSVPIFKNGALAGAIGISGDGIDQDDMVAFLGLANAGIVLGSGVANAPAPRRVDTITVPGGQLRYVNCPVAPFLDTTATNVCNGI
jgi:uncharacterized protein GlcG (DUF336 family)